MTIGGRIMSRVGFVLFFFAFGASHILVAADIPLGLSSCNDPPTINKTEKVIRPSPPFVEGSTIDYICLNGYEPYGRGIFTCLNGHWSGSFNCTVRKCPSLKRPDHGRMENTCKEVACVAIFFCNEGYQRVGPESSYCRTNGSWSHAVPECHIMNCSSPVIKHSNLNFTRGVLHVFGTALSVRCNEGYIQSGFSIMYCDNNGQWTQAPDCLPSECSSYPGLEDECVEKTKIQRLPDGRFLYFIYCTENGTRMNDRPATCSSGSWDDLSIRCHCSCKVNDRIEGVLYENFNPLALLKHGETLKWHCEDGYYINATSDLLICKDGEIGTPKCDPNTEVESEKSRGSVILVICLVCSIAISVIIIIIYKRRCCRKGKTYEDAHNTILLLPVENTPSRELNEDPLQVKTDGENQDAILKARETHDYHQMLMRNAEAEEIKLRAGHKSDGLGPLHGEKGSKGFRTKYAQWLPGDSSRKKRNRHRKTSINNDDINVCSTTDDSIPKGIVERQKLRFEEEKK